VRDGDGRLVATLDDYTVVRAPVHDLIAEGVQAGISVCTRKTVDAVKQLEATNGVPVTVKDLAAHLHVNRTTAWRRVQAALDAGYLTFLRSVFNAAIGDERIERSPVKSKFFFKEANQHVRYLTDEEETRLRVAMGKSEWPTVAAAPYAGFHHGTRTSRPATDSTPFGV
jgi:hypothetical protein